MHLLINLIFLTTILLSSSYGFSNSYLLLSSSSSSLHFKHKRDTTQDQQKQETTKPEIRSFNVTSNIKYRYAETIVSSKVVNPVNYSQEINFTVTLPESAFISQFSMVIKDKEYKAYVKEKDEAKKDYQKAIERGDTAGHVELSTRDSNLFLVSVNIEELGKVTFILKYEQLLKRTLGFYENVINVNPGQIVKELAVYVNIEESTNITSIQVPNLKIGNEITPTEDTKHNNLAIIEQTSGNKALITWKPNVEQQLELSNYGVNGQLIIRYDVDRTTNSNQILVDEGYFVHFYAPADLKTLPKHVVFALDISGSMGGSKIEQLREALIEILQDIDVNDFFTLILFSDSVQLWTLDGTVGEATPTWHYNVERTTPLPDGIIDERFIIKATKENVEKAKIFARSMNDTGGTNIIAALRKSLEISQWGQKNNAKGAEPLIIFLTDGQPNVEMDNTNDIVTAVTKLNTDRYAIFSLAFGDYADYNFLRKLSLQNNGFARNIYVASDTHIQLKNFYKEIASPLLSNVTFGYIPGQVDEESLTKIEFGNLFNGSELIVAGKLANGMESISGNLTGNSVQGQICIALPPIENVNASTDNRTFGHLEKLWAYLYIQQLIDNDTISSQDNSTFKQKAIELSMKYSFVTPYTSMVVVKPNETQQDGNVVKGKPAEDEGAAQNVKIAHQQFLFAPLPPGLSTPYSPLGLSANSFSYTQDSVAEDDILEDVLTTKPELNTTVTEISTPGLSDNSTIEPALNISSIQWLNGTNEVKFPSSNNTYTLAPPDFPNTEFQFCLFPNKQPGHCRHLAHCVLKAVIESYEEFLLYGEQCVIDARFVGICCPDNRKTTLKTPINSTTEVVVSH